jgi:diguanylate cyclase (GGDEF)-like protein
VARVLLPAARRFNASWKEPRMHQLAVIAAPKAWPGSWSFPDFRLHHLSDVTALGADARFDGIALVAPPADTLAQTLEALKERERSGTFATLLVGASDANTPALLSQYAFDGFIDLSWSSDVAAANVRIALGHVELGRNLVEIQRVVIHQAREQMVSLYEQAIHDGLTNLFNHRYFAEMMERRHERSRRLGETYALVFIDLDNLKQLNTRLGHAGGSQALNELAKLIAASIRATDVAVRLGGDEFAVFLSNCDQAQGIEFARRLCTKLRAHAFDCDGQSVSISVSCGVASYPEDGVLYSELLKHADAALLHAKAQGKDRAVGFTAVHQQAALSQ